MGVLDSGAVLVVSAGCDEVSAGADGVDGDEDEDEVIDITSVPAINLMFRSTETLFFPGQ